MNKTINNKKIPIFCLLTDFGLLDPYVGQIKGVILSNLPNAQLIDITHEIIPHNILQASFFLTCSWKYLPENSITVVVVDPGVGTNRNILVLKKQNKIVIAPDNGVLTRILEKYPSPKDKLYVVDREKLSKFTKGEISSTFHGRDIFAPLAVYLYTHDDIYSLGSDTSKDKIHKIFFPKFKIDQKIIKAPVIHIDRFGNCVLGIEDKFKDILSKHNIYLQPHFKKIYLVSAYSEIPEKEIGIIDGSQGYLELSLNQDNLSKRFNIKIGDILTLELK